MKDIEQIKEELRVFCKKYYACKEDIKDIKGSNLTELFENINYYISWYRSNDTKIKEFNSIFDNQLIIENGILLCNCTELTTIEIPNSVTIIEKRAFAYCKGLKSIIIPDSVTSIRAAAFCNCIRLISIEIPKSVTQIGNNAFEGCNKNLKFIEK